MPRPAVVVARHGLDLADTTLEPLAGIEELDLPAAFAADHWSGSSSVK
jgi:hypothetical protein